MTILVSIMKKSKLRIFNLWGFLSFKLSVVQLLKEKTALWGFNHQKFYTGL